MKCRSVQKKFSAYQDRELKPREQEEVSRHLLSCQSCREQYEKIERVWQTLGELGEIRPGPWFYRQLVRKIKEPREQGLLQALQRVFQTLRAPAIASIILLIGILAGTYFGNILVQFDFLPFQHKPVNYSQGKTLFSSLGVFDPVPSGTLADGYLRLVSYTESDSR
jgi:predicted anti-sigma-YlaC factor YlaD